MLLLLSNCIHSHDFVTWIFVGTFAYLVAVENSSEYRTQGNDLQRNFSHYFSLMNITIFTAISGIRFVQSLVMGLLTVVMQIAVYGSVAIAAAKGRDLLIANPMATVWVGRAVGLVFIAVALVTVWQALKGSF